MVIRKECPCCGRENAENKKIFHRDFRHCRELTIFSYYDVYCCAQCGMVYAGNIEESMPLDIYYKRMSRYEGESYRLPEGLWQLYQYSVNMISEFMAKDTYILDIGCAFGGLLNELKKTGYQNLYGLEPSRKNGEYAMKEYGIPVYEGTLGDVIPGHNEKKFDLVILSAVLEHLTDVRKSVEMCQSYLKEDGKLLVTVPDVDLFASHEDLYQEFSAEHINYFDLRSLSRMMGSGSVGEKSFRLVSAKRDEGSIMGLAGNLISLWELVSNETASESSDILVEGLDGTYETEAMDSYLDSCRMFSIHLQEKMRRYRVQNGYYIWGAGTNTAMLIQEGIVDINDIRGIFDSNRNYEGLTAYQQTVRNPEELRKLPPLPILISSQYAYGTIEKAIKEMGLRNDILDLFGV